MYAIKLGDGSHAAGLGKSGEQAIIVISRLGPTGTLEGLNNEDDSRKHAVLEICFTSQNAIDVMRRQIDKAEEILKDLQ